MHRIGRRHELLLIRGALTMGIACATLLLKVIFAAVTYLL